MKYKKLNGKYLVRIDKDEELVSKLKELCENEKITLGSISGIGATNKATIGLYNTEKKIYQSEELTGDHEITSLLGNVSTKEDDIYLHIHATLCDDKYNCKGGHLNSAVISGTFEGYIEFSDYEINRFFDDASGLNILDI